MKETVYNPTLVLMEWLSKHTPEEALKIIHMKDTPDRLTYVKCEKKLGHVHIEKCFEVVDDSGNPVKIIAGEEIKAIYNEITDAINDAKDAKNSADESEDKLIDIHTRMRARYDNLEYSYFD